MIGEKLSVNLHVVSAPIGLIRNLTSCIGRCHLDVAGYVVPPYASGLAILVEDELELGVTIVDLGGGNTTIASFYEGNLVHIDSIPLGGSSITNDIARGLATPLAQAERLKTLYGTLIPSSSDDRESILVTQMGETDKTQAYQIPKGTLIHIIRSRVEEILELVGESMRRSPADPVVYQRIVLTGGTSQLQGIREMASHILGKQVRLGQPTGLIGMGDIVTSPTFSTCAGVEFIVANTDAQALEQSLVDRAKRIQLGLNITQGLGAGSKPDVGRASAEESMEEVIDHLRGSNMVFITAGMGGGTGTGAAPVIARAARESEKGIDELQQYVDTLIIIPNQNLFRIANERTTFADAFKMADDVLYSGVRGMGKAMMGTGEAEGDRRALDAAEAAISNPLLDDVSMKGAKGVLINITGGYDMTLYEVDEAANRIREDALVHQLQLQRGVQSMKFTGVSRNRSQQHPVTEQALKNNTKSSEEDRDATTKNPMTRLTVLTIPDPRLRIKAEPVAQVDDALRQFMADLMETMYAEDDNFPDLPPIKMANPEIIWHSKETIIEQESCLSVPEQFANVKRFKAVRVRYLDEHNQSQEIEGEDLLAKCLQHEIDHLDGILSLLGADLIVNTLEKVSAIVPIPQPTEDITIKVLEASVVPAEGKPGQFLKTFEHSWIVCCGEGALSLEKIQKPGSKSLSTAEFLRGYSVFDN
eukprot:gene14864-15001_t